MEKSHYEKLLIDNITKAHKQSNSNVYNSINLEEKHNAKKLEIADRVDKAAFNNATPFYNDIYASGYKENLIYQKDLLPSNKVRQRKITWFNPP